MEESRIEESKQLNFIMCAIISIQWFYLSLSLVSIVATLYDITKNPLVVVRIVLFVSLIIHVFFGVA